MRWKIILFLLLCWLIPFCFLIGVFGVYLASNHSETTAQSYESQLEFNNRICVERLDDAVTQSRQATYDGEILKYRTEYLNDVISYDESQKGYFAYLSRLYQNNPSISAAILYLRKEDNIQTSSIYNESGGGSFQSIRSYWKDDHQKVQEYAEDLGTNVGFLSANGNLYLIRNLVDKSYTVNGMLILLLNKEYCFNSITHYPLQDGVAIQINDIEVMTLPARNNSLEDSLDKIEEDSYGWIHGRLWLNDREKGNAYHLRTTMQISSTVNRFPFYGYPFLVIGMVLSLLVMLLILLKVFRKEITEPVENLSSGLQKIENGELGFQIENTSPNQEFDYLTNVVNEMSAHLKEQITKIYQEEIALREARIMALQSHINPHFLNNTMEIINWEARLGGNEKVSNMIEALSTMMDAAMDRRKRPEVSLEEEMGYVNSYLYIMRERLGKRLTVEIDLPEEIMSCPVPRLILQPVIENAIDHGVVPNGSGTVVLKGYYTEEYLYLEIWNNGRMTEDDKARIVRLLDPEYNTSKEPSGNLGIANVNQRLRILFGEPCGLTIDETDGQICAKLTIPLRKLNKKKQEITD